MIDTKCPRCKKKFQVKPYRVKGGKRPFCSIACKATSVLVNCDECGREVRRKPAELKERAFCSYECSRKHTTFAAGEDPWNKGMKGLHLSPETEIKPGQRINPHVPIGTVRIRTRKRDGKQRAWIKTADPNTWRLRCHVVWMTEHGPIPDGMIIHHEDRDTLNDSIGNLRMLTKSEHMKEHEAELREAKKQACK